MVVGAESVILFYTVKFENLVWPQVQTTIEKFYPTEELKLKSFVKVKIAHDYF